MINWIGALLAAKGTANSNNHSPDAPKNSDMLGLFDLQSGSGSTTYSYENSLNMELFPLQSDFSRLLAVGILKSLAILIPSMQSVGIETCDPPRFVMCTGGHSALCRCWICDTLGICHPLWWKIYGTPAAVINDLVTIYASTGGMLQGRNFSLRRSNGHLFFEVGRMVSTNGQQRLAPMRHGVNEAVNHELGHSVPLFQKSSFQFLESL
ncbi:uncharacterized protein TNCV_3905491 [Trichonephila clavipes]|nr:uncharacterized protein TNCV_3905491 [Trichonephila clavipes]